MHPTPRLHPALTSPNSWGYCLYENNAEETTIHYVNKYYERSPDPIPVGTRRYHYIYGDNGIVALHVHYSAINKDSMYYVHTDHLGTYCAITNENKKVWQRNFFDVWGNNVGTANFSITKRGFTGHEHYPQFKIINMNARLYDPVIGRFFSPDNFVQIPEFTQAMNRYSYCLNNPLGYIDPTGNKIVFSGEHKIDALNQLQNQVSNIKFGLKEDGTLFIESGKPKTKIERYLNKTINNDKITVNIEAENSNIFTAWDGKQYKYDTDRYGDMVAGAYGGSKVMEDGTVNAFQYVNPARLGEWDKRVGDTKTGGYLLHEIAEGYASGKAAFKTRVGDEIGGLRYETVHQQANKISGGNWYRADQYETRYRYENSFQLYPQSVKVHTGTTYSRYPF